MPISVEFSIPVESWADSLLVVGGGNFRVKSTVSAQDDIRGRCQLQYENSSGTWVDFGQAAIVGYQNITTTGIATVFLPLSFSGRLTNTTTQVSPSGDYNVRIAGEADFADNEILATYSTITTTMLS